MVECGTIGRPGGAARRQPRHKRLFFAADPRRGPGVNTPHRRGSRHLALAGPSSSSRSCPPRSSRRRSSRWRYLVDRDRRPVPLQSTVIPSRSACMILDFGAALAPVGRRGPIAGAHGHPGRRRRRAAAARLPLCRTAARGGPTRVASSCRSACCRSPMGCRASPRRGTPARLAGSGAASRRRGLQAFVSSIAAARAPESPATSPLAGAGGVASIPGIAAAAPSLIRAPADGGRPGRLIESTETRSPGHHGRVGLGPRRAAMGALDAAAGPVARRVVIGRAAHDPAAGPDRHPATLQRDLVVAATEAERARLAADIHDDALQELTLLVRRLEAAGDTEGADIGADRRRPAAGDLRRPAPADPRRPRRRAGARLAGPPDRAARRRRGPARTGGRGAATRRTSSWRSSASPRRRSRTRSSTAGRRSSSATVDARRAISLAIDDAGPGITDDAADRRREGRPVRAPEHGPAGRADRGDPRRPALADRRHARRARVAAALTGGRRAIGAGSPIRLRCDRRRPPGRPRGHGGAAARHRRDRGRGTAGSIDEASALIDGRRPTCSCSTSGSAPMRAPAADRAVARPTAGRRPAIIVLTAYDYPQYAEAALRLGAVRVRAQDRAARRAARRDPAGRRRRDGVLDPAARGAGLARLSARELDVVRLVVDGRSNDEIGAALGDRARRRSRRTCARLFERFDLASRTELATRALREGWLELA